MTPDKEGWFWWRRWPEDPWTPARVGRDEAGLVVLLWSDGRRARHLPVADAGGEWREAALPPEGGT